MKYFVMLILPIIIVCFLHTCCAKLTATDVNKISVDTNIITYCIAPFSNNTNNDDYDGLVAGFADMLTVTLAEQKNIIIVERQQLASIMKEQEISLKALLKPETVIKAGRILGVDRLITGGITLSEGDLLINTHIYDISSARLIASKEVRGPAKKALDLALEINEKIGLATNCLLPKLKQEQIDKSPQASLHFMQGLGFYFAGNYDRAIMEFMRTVDLDPLHKKARLWTAKSFAKTGEQDHAQIELNKIKNIFPLSEETVLAKNLTVGEVFECEDMKIIAQSPGVIASSQELTSWVINQWSNGTQLFVKGQKIGDFIDLHIPVKDSKPRKLILHATKSWDYGILRFTVNSKSTGKDLDTYAPQVIPTGPIDLGVFEPKEGAIILRVEVVGGNPASRRSKSYFGLDYVQLLPK